MIDPWPRKLIISSVIGGYTLSGGVLIGLVASSTGSLGRILWDVGGVGVIALLWFFLGMLYAIALAGTGTISFERSDHSGRHRSVKGAYRLAPVTYRDNPTGR